MIILSLKLSSRILAAALACACGVGLALACGFDYPSTILDNREKNLLELTPMDWLSTQIEDIVPPASDSLLAREGNEKLRADVIERSEIDDLHAAQLLAIRAAPDGVSAYTKGRGLPEVVRLYIAGAVDYARARIVREEGGDPQPHARAAVEYFERALTLAPSDRAARATWASYMAGRAHILAGERRSAIARFEQTRTLARQGLPDPLGLAVASFGEEARVELEAGNLPRAIELYLEQAARGSQVARNSLRRVAGRLVREPALAIQFINEPRVQRLWFAGALAAGRDDFDFTYATTGQLDFTIQASEDQNSGDESFEEGEAPESVEGESQEDPWAAMVIQVTDKIEPDKATQLDQLAALAYATGRFELAKKLAVGVASPMASVVRAKLALRDGDREVAAREYALAIAAREQARTIGDRRISEGAWARVLAEHGAFAVSRSDYVAALHSFMEAGSEYWSDAAYLAERVLTIDELQAFAEQRVPIGEPLPPATENPASDSEEFSDDDMEWVCGWPRLTVSQCLRHLLARRQVRAGRLEAAMSNFRNNDFLVGADEQSRFSDVARRYVDSLDKSQTAWTAIERAQGAYNAARIVREYGMELMGYELAPDFTILSGSSEYEIAVPEGPYAGPDEASRLSANEIPETRFHYRATASDLAQRAANDLPPRSQAFAAVLCKSMQWARHANDGERERKGYERYVREAAYVPWSPFFGSSCREPDFERAGSMLWETRVLKTRRALRPYKWVIYVSLAAGVIAIAWSMRRRFGGRVA